MKCIVFWKHLQSKKTLNKNQDGSQEFIFLFITICTDGTTLIPNFMYQNITYNLQDVWLEDYNHSNEETYFVVSQKSWTNEDLRLF